MGGPSIGFGEEEDGDSGDDSGDDDMQDNAYGTSDEDGEGKVGGGDDWLLDEDDEDLLPKKRAKTAAKRS